ncbi:MAG: FIST C-terminal domain-containing protein, partial [Bacteroidales bacterium]|nr:FIST C-terminal domain-containing protein [Bacteroidales bacterium]
SIIVPVAWQEGTKIWLTERDEKGIFDGVDRIVKQVLNRLDGQKPVAVFHTDCATRGRKSFNQILKEEIINRLQYPICGDDNIPWLGSYGYAEFAMLGGLNRIHQFTSALFVIFRHNE